MIDDTTRHEAVLNHGMALKQGGGMEKNKINKQSAKTNTGQPTRVALFFSLVVFSSFSLKFLFRIRGSAHGGGFCFDSICDGWMRCDEMYE